MPVQIQTGSVQGPGSEYLLTVNPDGSINVSGTLNAIISGTIVIGSVSANVDSIYIQSGANIIGSFYPLETTPNVAIKNNPAFKLEYIISGTSAGVTGSQVGSVTQFIGTGSYVRVLTWSNNLLTDLGSWV